MGQRVDHRRGHRAARDQGRAHGAAFLVATHDDRLLARCDRALRLLDGCIASDRQPFKAA